jgi:hypothetical protein
LGGRTTDEELVVGVGVEEVGRETEKEKDSMKYEIRVMSALGLKA